MPNKWSNAHFLRGYGAAVPPYQSLPFEFIPTELYVPRRALASGKGRSKKSAQHELQNAAVAEVSNFVGGIDSQHER